MKSNCQLLIIGAGAAGIGAARAAACAGIDYLAVEASHRVGGRGLTELSLIHISEPTRLGMISYAVFCLKKSLVAN